MITFDFNGDTYNYIPYEQLQDGDLPYNYSTKKREKEHFLDYGCGFDIETTKVPDGDITSAQEDKTFSFMYVWQFSIDDITIIGRTWDEFNELLDRLAKRLHLTEKRRLLVFIHNQKFEWSFMKKQVKWATKTIKSYGKILDKRPDVFSLDDRTVVRAVSHNFVEFRDSYVLTQRGLGRVAKDFNLGIKKLSDVGFDYDTIRHNKTPLTNKELAYCINDVQILSRFYHLYIKPTFIEKGHKIPLTATGIVRDDLKRSFKDLPKAEKEKYRYMVRGAFPNQETYNFMMHKLYRGGYTHANIMAVNELFDYGDDLSSWDFKSSYPATLLHCRYPYKFIKKPVSMFNKIMASNYKAYFEDWAVWGVFTITGVYNKTSLSLESENKIIEYSKDAIFDNGRLLEASWIKVALTEQDILNYLDFYTVNDLSQWTCEHLEISKKEYLPKFFRDMVLKYYFEKEEAGKFKKTEPMRYAIRKSMLNSLYGMLATSIVQEDTRYYEDVGIIGKGNATKDFDEAVKSAILLPQWSIYCTAYARRNLTSTIINKLKDDIIYSDTDSAKIKNTSRNVHVFKEYNDRMERINATMYVGDYDRAIFKDLGKYDFESRIVKLKTLGCKRYLHTEIEYNKDSGKYKQVTSATVSGLIKGSLQAFCEANGLDIYETFNSDLNVDDKIVFNLKKDVSKKKTAIYFDQPFTATITDYLGNTMEVGELSGCSIIDIPFKMSMNTDFINLIITMQNNKRRKGRAY